MKIRSMGWVLAAIAGSWGAAAPATLRAQDAWGHLAGKITVAGQLPELEDEVIDKDQSACLIDGKPPKDDNLVVGADGGLRDVYIMLFLDRGDKAPAIHPSYDELKKTTLVLDNIQCRFVPHALFVRTGQTLTLKNSDEVGHNCHIQTFGNEENVNLAANSSVDVVLKKAEKVPGPVVCDIHKWMDALILVRDDPYCVISAEDGSFRLENIPAGKWKFQFWHKKKGYLRDLEVNGQKTGRRGEVELAIGNGETLDLGTIQIPATEFSKK